MNPSALWLVILLGLGSLLNLAHATDDHRLRIGVMTMQPGNVFFERFGHDALVVLDTTNNWAFSYNFGYFDPTEPGFVANFIAGKMEYSLVALPLKQDLAQYQQYGRGVSIQWLNLSATQVQRLADHLAQHSQPENARYRYDYFTANCATMVRDALNQAMDGHLQAQLAGRSRGHTYRSEAVRLAQPESWMWLGFDLGLGPWADQPLSRWQEAFIPMRLAESLREVHNREGQPLVYAEEQWLPHRLAAEPVERSRHWWPWLVLGLVLARLIRIAARRWPRALGGFALIFWLICGVTGLLLLYLWGWSEHRAAWANRNALLLNPLALALLPLAWQWLRGHRPNGWLSRFTWLIAGLAGLALPLHWLSLQPQFNMQWIVLLLPLHIRLAQIATNTDYFSVRSGKASSDVL